MKITTKLESINPEKATAYLKFNRNNRPIKQAVVDGYALDMRKGHWLINHQGIAFDESGNLLDGQHRLEAIRASGVAVEILVTRGLPVGNKNGLAVFTMDTVDGGKRRSIGDQLALHGATNSNLVAAVASTIALCCCGQYVKLTTPSARGVIAIYNKEIELAIAKRSVEVGLRSAAVIGAIAFAMKSHRDKICEFYKLLVSGEGLHKTGETSPVYVLRKLVMSPQFVWKGGSWRQRQTWTVLNAARHFVEGGSLSQIKFTAIGHEFFQNAQKTAAAKVAEIVLL